MNPSSLLNNTSGIINVSYEGKEILCRNAYMDRLILNDRQCVIITTLFIVEMIVILPLNAFMMKGIYKTKFVASTTWQYILLLGYAGCSLSLLIIPLNIILFTTERASRFCQLEYTTIFIGQINCQFIAYLIFLLALHRYWMTVSGQTLPTCFAKVSLTSKSSITLAFALSLLHGGASVNFFGMIETSMPNILMKALDATIGIVVSAIYLRLYIKIRKCIKNWRVRFTGDKGTERNVQTEALEKLPTYMRSLAITISLVVLALALCYIPFIIMDSWTSWYTFYRSEKAPESIRFVYYLTYGSVFFTSIANASVVIYRDRDLRFYMKSVIYMDCLDADVHPVL